MGNVRNIKMNKAIIVLSSVLLSHLDAVLAFLLFVWIIFIVISAYKESKRDGK